MLTATDQQLFPNPEYFRGIHLKKTMKDRCMVIGETTMYYSNAGSVQVLSPIPGSPTLVSEPWSDHIRPDSPRKASLIRLDSKDKIKKTMSGKKNTSKKTKRGSDYCLPPIKNVPTAGFPKTTVNRNENITTTTETCQPINMPSFRAGRGQKAMTKGGNPSVPFNLLDQESFSKLTASTKRIQTVSLKKIEAKFNMSSVLSVESVRLPVPRGARRTSTSVKFLPPLYTDGLPPLRVHAMVAQ